MNYKAGLYIRLSKEDKNESINNQKRLLIDYANKMHYQIYDIYIDDGYTGTNFNRPAFKKLLADINTQKLNLVIVKDLSRLGRDYIKTGELIENFFPSKNIRFIALTDSIDTFLDDANNDIAPFKAIINDLYAKDISKKIRASFKAMRDNGLWTGGCLPLGYKHQNKKIIINNKESPIIKTIFDTFIKTNSLTKTTNYLNNHNIPTFSIIRKKKETKWNNISVKNILTNPIYTGSLVQNKNQRISYKYHKIIKKNKNDWIIQKKNHQAIISPKTFNKVQSILLNSKRSNKLAENIFDGILYCAECKHHIIIRNMNSYNKRYLCCNYYRTNKSNCTAHAFNYDQLEYDILNILRKHLKNQEIKNISLRKLVLATIKKVEITQNKEVTIFFNFKNITK